MTALDLCRPVCEREVENGHPSRRVSQNVDLDDGAGQHQRVRFHRYSPGTRSRVARMIGGDMFGKVALIAPENRTYVDLAAHTFPPAVGYLAQCFLVPDLDAARAAASRVGAAEFSAPVALARVPGGGAARGSIVRSPGSGALIQLLERAS
jgi:hypothetical protein